MKACWSEGDLRALLDGELPQEQAAAAERHLAQCAKCAAAYGELTGRAARVAALMDALSDEIAGPAPESRRTFGRPAVWVGAVAALAAALVFAMVLSRRTPEQQVQAVLPPRPAPEVVESPLVTPAPPVVAAAAPGRTAPERVHRLPSRPVRATPVQYYMALDEEPIDTGLVMRVALPSGVQADVIVDGDGRARAIRPVSAAVKEER